VIDPMACLCLRNTRHRGEHK